MNLICDTPATPPDTQLGDSEPQELVKCSEKTSVSSVSSYECSEVRMDVCGVCTFCYKDTLELSFQWKHPVKEPQQDTLCND